MDKYQIEITFYTQLVFSPLFLENQYVIMFCFVKHIMKVLFYYTLFYNFVVHSWGLFLTSNDIDLAILTTMNSAGCRYVFILLIRLCNYMVVKTVFLSPFTNII